MVDRCKKKLEQLVQLKQVVVLVMVAMHRQQIFDLASVPTNWGKSVQTSETTFCKKWGK